MSAIQYILVPDNSPIEADAIKTAAKKGGKDVLTGLSKAGMIFTKRVAEGALSAEIAQSTAEETFDKIKVASNEMGKAILRGAIEGASETISGILAGVNTFSDEMKKQSDDHRDNNEEK